MNITRERFEELVREAIQELPLRFQNQMDNVAIVVEEKPTRRQLEKNNIPPNGTLLGLYEGVPKPERSNYSAVTPDKITIFQGPIESICFSMEELEQQVRDTVYHEIAHHFGMNEERVRRAEQERHNDT